MVQRAIGSATAFHGLGECAGFAFERRERGLGRGDGLFGAGLSVDRSGATGLRTFNIALRGCGHLFSFGPIFDRSVALFNQRRFGFQSRLFRFDPGDVTRGAVQSGLSRRKCRIGDPRFGLFAGLGSQGLRQLNFGVTNSGFGARDPSGKARLLHLGDANLRFEGLGFVGKASERIHGVARELTFPFPVFEQLTSL